jgi:hypothetical protein
LLKRIFKEEMPIDYYSSTAKKPKKKMNKKSQKFIIVLFFIAILILFVFLLINNNVSGTAVVIRWSYCKLIGCSMTGNLTTTGNVTADYFFGNGQYLTGISAGGGNSGLFVNYTPITTTGNITNGTLNGYSASTAICNVYYVGSHMCTIDEIIQTINSGVINTNFTATFWASEGAPGYFANANDCDGWTSPSTTALGSIWVGSTSHTNTYGSGYLVSCSALRAIGCCK